MTVKRLLIGGSLLFCALMVWGFLTFFEHYTEERDRGWGPEARRNWFLAAEQYLAAVGLEPRRAENLSVVNGLSADATLFIASSSLVYNPQRVAELLGWVQSGGHAIVVARTEGFDVEEQRSEARDWLLEALDVSIMQGHEEYDFAQPLQQLLGEDAELGPQQSPGEALREYNRRIGKGDSTQKEAQAEIAREKPRNPEVEPQDLVSLTSDSGVEFQLHFNASHLLYHPGLDDNTVADAPVFWARVWRDDEAVPFMQFERGSGVITLLTDSEIWHSQRIGHFDHAYFLQLLAGNGEFVFLTRPRFESLSYLARKYAAEGFFASALALLGWLLLRARRFGPLQPAPEVRRRSLLEHISACGHYYWQQDHCEQLLRGQRAELLRRLSATDADPGSRHKLAERLSAATGLSEHDIIASLWGIPAASEESFTEHMRTLQRIEAVL
ncbi:DUF4350 domain-containing protein [Microbulbifer sp. 2205BS26-8]|uniref:DUF4350 domain-containing protein n=1 Tax=Microbulbifer sp. 2205BS26-8 TaxID=3064386 RepID=UPI00273D65EE|nr:DUF4350 domain-containing protein [Microbulbifer sp. 2205BS26-8]MDP5209673.1 DUF4350 domain-containing protein [Microbulbifer sp. 2205BS26-8]